MVDQATARRRTLIEEILATLPEDAQKGVAEALRAFSDAAGEVPDSQWPLPGPAEEAARPPVPARPVGLGRRVGATVTAASGWPGKAAGWLRAGRGGLFVLALVVGAGSGLGAVVFRYLIYFFTWLATGHDEFGQQGRVASTHLPWLGPVFFAVIPAVGGLVYGPLIYRFAREARGHGVPEVGMKVYEEVLDRAMAAAGIAPHDDRESQRLVQTG